MIVKESLRFLGIPLRKQRTLRTDEDGMVLYQPTKNTRTGALIEVGAQHLLIREITTQNGVNPAPTRRIRLPNQDYIHRHKTRLPGMYHLFKRVK